jgi:MoCo/4Fe-4S cofactor protein with predicted Tat translocation signal
MHHIERMDGRPAYWRSLDEFSGTPEFREMVRRGADGAKWESLPPATRRRFLQIMGASIAMAGLAGCRYPKETIVPFARPAGYDPGMPQQYATTMEIAGVASGLVATSYDGRPIKVDGNPAHPQNLGGSDPFAQASVLELYDPARSRGVVRRDGERSSAQFWDDFGSFIRGRASDLSGRGGEGLAILTEASSSPSLAAMRALLASAYPRARWTEYESISRDEERKGTAALFGRPLRPVLFLDKAEVIVSLDEDLLGAHPAAVMHARDFAAGRRRRGKPSRLYAIESAYTITGVKAEHRFAVSSRMIPIVAARLAAVICGQNPAALSGLAAYTAHPYTPRFIEAMARDLERSRGRALVVAGPRQPAFVHALAHAMNAELGNIGTTVRYAAESDPGRPDHVTAIASVVEDARAGRIDTLLILGGNPVFDAPVDLDFAGALGSVPNAIHLSLHENETSHACRWHLPRAHYLESWGDARSWDGTIGITQPLIEPLYGGKSPIEVLSILIDNPAKTGYEIVRRTAQGSMGSVATGAMISGAGTAGGFVASALANFETLWRTSLNDGFVRGSGYPLETPVAVPLAQIRIPEPPAQGAESDLEVVFIADAKIHDGRFSGNAWLQELPDPLTKLTWDNAALIAPATAARLEVRADDIVTLKAGGRSIEIPVYVMPGIAPESIVVPLGYGRTAAGPVGSRVGANAQAIRTSRAMGFASGAAIERTGRKHALSCTQEHHAIDLVGLREMGRRVKELVREVDPAQADSRGTAGDGARGHEGAHGRKDAHGREGALGHEGVHGQEDEPPQLFPLHDYDKGHQWAMAIDLDACTGCSACVIACQSENNIPVVGAEQIRRGREMHWLRIDRYFSGDPEEPRVSHQPVACVQCENAPCEQVCPVGATAHSDEGLNEMVYNRCIGTRYCSNNCPYKVRRFNWFNFHQKTGPIEKMAMNPDVTVRSRGVMEKCTFCVQRIEQAKIRSRASGRAIVDGEVVPACAQACPAKAIVFGDRNDPNSKVRATLANPRSYEILEELNTRARTQYLAKIRNVNPELAGAAAREGSEHANLRGPDSAGTEVRG